MSGNTHIPAGHPMAVKKYSVAAFAETQRRPSLRKNMTGPAPKQSDAEKKLGCQTSADYPIVQVRDLAKGAGDNCSVDLFNIITGKPVMGDKKIAGKMMGLSFSHMDIRIDQYRAGVEPGGRMAQKRTIHNLRTIAKANLSGYGARLEDQLALVHLAGARGYDDALDWAIPLASDEDFEEIVVNPVEPPTHNRRILAGSATSVANVGTTDIITLATIERLRAICDEDVFPMQPIRLQDPSGNLDPAADDAPLFMLLMTSRQWYQFQQSASAKDWQTAVMNARNRVAGWNHPLFMGDVVMWNNILCRKMNRAIRFPQGSTVLQEGSNGVIAPATAAQPIDRALLLGAQALAEAYGSHGKSGYHAHWHEEESDHGNAVEISMAFMGGKRKVKFKRKDTGAYMDHGVIAIDSYAPDPR